jgi:DNA-binding transcriptional LysR family regulator
MADIIENDIRRIDGGLLLVFRGLLRNRRTTAVAKELGLSQSAVSHALARLRDLFEDPLFIRRPHGLEPTRRALELGPRVDALIDQLGSALEDRKGFDPLSSQRRFAISAPEFVTALIAPSLVKAIRRLAPRVQFGIGHMSPSLALHALRRGEIDLALGRFGTLGEEFVTEKIYEDRYCITARRGHPFLKGRITSAQYKSTGHVYAYSESETGVEEAGLTTPEVAYNASVPGWLLVLTAVAECDAIATAPKRLVERQAKRLGLQVLEPPFVPWRIEVSAVRRAGVADAGIEWLLEQIRKAIGGEL